MTVLILFLACVPAAVMLLVGIFWYIAARQRVIEAEKDLIIARLAAMSRAGSGARPK